MIIRLYEFKRGYASQKIRARSRGAAIRIYSAKGALLGNPETIKCLGKVADA